MMKRVNEPDENTSDSLKMEQTVDSPTPLQKPLSSGFHFGERYVIIELIGEGGMGTVYRAHDKDLNREVALKLIKPSISQETVIIERFKREIAFASRITHRNVLRIHDLGDVDGTKYVSMNYVKGENLSTILKRGRLPRERALHLIKQFCLALKAAHDEGVLHRDLKPQNILVDEQDNLFITDFGLARSLDLSEDPSSLTGTGIVIGTPMYMSPEQIKAEECSKASDIYSFGLILYEMLTGRFPFDMRKGYESVFKRVQERPKDPRDIDASIPDYLAAIAVKCLEPQLEQRYQDVSEILETLGSQRIERRRKKMPWQFWAVVGAILIALAVVLAIRRWPGQPVPVHQMNVVVLPLENGTEDAEFAWISAAIPDLVTRVLREADNTPILSAERLSQIQRGLQLSEQRPYDITTIRKIAELGNANVILSGRYTKSNQELRVDVSLVRVGMNETQLSKREFHGSMRLIVEDLSSLIQKNIPNKAKNSAGQPREIFNKLLNTPEPVIQSYYQGLMYFDGGDPSRALKQLETMSKQNPAFALAHVRLAEIYLASSEEENAQRSLKAAGNAIDTLPQYDRYLVQAMEARIQKNEQNAIEAYKRLQSMYPNDVRSYSDAGDFYYQLEDWSRALENYNKAWEIDPKSVYTLYHLGLTEWKNANPQNALKYLTEAQTLSAQFASERERAELLIALGIAYKNLQYYESALEHYQKSLEITKRIDAKILTAKTLGNIALVYTEMGNYEAAQRSYEQALEITNELGDKHQTGVFLNNLGILAEKFGHFDTALDYYTQGLNVARMIRSRSEITNRLSNIGLIYYLQGRYTDAATYYQLGLQEIGNSDRRLKAYLLFYRGLLSTEQAKYRDALDSFAAALEIWRNSQDAVGLAFTLIDSARVYNLAGRFDEGGKRLAEAQRVAEDIGDKEVSADLFMRRCEMLRMQQELSSTETLITQSQMLANESKNVAAIVAARLEAGALYNQLQQPDRSLSFLQKLLSEAEHLGLKPLAARTRTEIGRAYELQQKQAEALREIGPAIELAGQLGIQETLIKGHFAAARIYQSQKQLDKALNHYQQALDALDEIRKDSGQYADSFTGRKDIQDLLRQAAVGFQLAGQEKQFARYAGWIARGKN